MADLDPGTITKLLNRAGKGDGGAREELIEIVYPQLVVQAKKRLRKEPLLQAKDPESLVHDVIFAKLPQQKDDWHGRGEFYGYAKRAMWQACVDEVRRIKVQKKQPLSTDKTAPWMITPQRMLDVEHALQKLRAAHGERREQVVRLRFIDQRTVEETAAILGVSTRTVISDWAFAFAWLKRELGTSDLTG